MSAPSNDGGTAFPVLTRNNPALHSGNEYLQMVSRKSLKKTGSNMALPETLSVSADADSLGQRQENRSFLRRIGEHRAIAGSYEVPDVLTQNELVGRGRPRHRCITSARQERGAPPTVSLVQHKACRHAGRHILLASSRASLVPKMQSNAHRIKFQRGQIPHIGA